MNIGLIDVDSHNFPNLCLMKISAWHKQQGDQVEWWKGGLIPYDKVYGSRVFDSTYTPDQNFNILADEIVMGGTGYDLQNKLPDEIEHMMPDYSLYNITDTAYGFLSRGCPRACKFCIVSEKEGRKSTKVANVSEWWDGQKKIKLLDPNLLACKDHMDLLGQLSETRAVLDFTQGLDARFLTDENINALNQIKTYQIHFAWDFMEQSEAVMRGLELYKKNGKVDQDHRKVYVLTNYDSTHEQDLERVYRLREMGLTPYVMIYDKGKFVDVEKRRMYPMKKLLKTFTHEQINHFIKCWRIQRWVNNIRVWRVVDKFENYNPRIS